MARLYDILIEALEFQKNRGHDLDPVIVEYFNE